MTDPRGRRGRVVPDPDRVTKVPGGSELRPPNPNKCYAHDYPWKAECPTCYHNAKADDDYAAMREFVWAREDDV